MHSFLSMLGAELIGAFRTLRRAPSFAAAAIAILALGIGANVAMFSLFESIVLQPLPYPEAGRLVGFKSTNSSKAITQPALSLADFRDFKERAQSYEQLAAFRPDFVGYAPNGGDPVQLVCGRVTEEFFPVFGTTALIGRTFHRDEFNGGSPRAVVLSFAAWRRWFGERADIIGESIMLDDQAVTVVGVMPDTFREPEFVDVWLPFPPDAAENLVRDSRFWTTVGRLKPTTSLAAAQAEADTVATALATEYTSTNRGWRLAVQPLLEMRVARVRTSFMLLLGAVGLVLAIACVNLANLMLARGVGRMQALAVRLALGATPGALTRSVLWESLLLALAGGAIGVGLASAGLRVLTDSLPAGAIPRSHTIAVDETALVFAFVLSAATGIAFGLLPAWQVRRANVNEVLKSTGTRGSSSRFAHSAQAGLIIGQVALTVVVLAAAGLLMKSLLNLQRTIVGFNPSHLLTVRVSPPTSRWRDFQQLGDYYERIATEIRRESGVTGITLNCSAPLTGITLRYPFWVEGRPAEDGNADEAVFNTVGDDYFRILGVPLLRGRTFDAHDDFKAAESHPVCVINQTMAKRLFGDADPIGRRIRTLPWMVRGYREIVGVVADVKQDTQADIPGPQLYVPQRQSPWFFTTLLVRGDNVSAATVRAAIRRADPTLTMTVRTMDEAIASTALEPRLRAVLFGLFAVAALTLSAFGIYASVSFTVGQRTREIGLRMALGAGPAMIIGWILRRAGTLAAIGVAGGLVGSLVSTQLLRSALYGVAPVDPSVLVVLAVALPTVVLAAAFVPALRGARFEPTRALQAD